jgi:hypothetical protein
MLGVCVGWDRDGARLGLIAFDGVSKPMDRPVAQVDLSSRYLLMKSRISVQLQFAEGESLVAK